MPLIGRDRVEAAIENEVIKLNKSVSAIVTKGLAAAIVATPSHFKDGGRLQAAWNLSVGSPDYASSGEAKGTAYALAGLSKMPEWVLGKKIYLTNPMPYADVVEYGGYPNPPENGTWTGEKYEKLSSGGYSKQAPTGMARINVTIMQQKIKAL